jgi:hypothetical protein
MMFCENYVKGMYVVVFVRFVNYPTRAVLTHHESHARGTLFSHAYVSTKVGCYRIINVHAGVDFG